MRNTTIGPNHHAREFPTACGFRCHADLLADGQIGTAAHLLSLATAKYPNRERPNPTSAAEGQYSKDAEAEISFRVGQVTI